MVHVLYHGWIFPGERMVGSIRCDPAMESDRSGPSRLHNSGVLSPPAKGPYEELNEVVTGGKTNGVLVEMSSDSAS